MMLSKGNGILVILSFVLVLSWGMNAYAQENAVERVSERSVMRKELARITDLRVVHRAGIEQLHDARTLAVYLKGWAGPDREPEVETLMIKSEGLYGLIRGVEYGADGMKAQFDVARQGEQNEDSSVSLPSRQWLELLRRARRSVAVEVNEFYESSSSLKKELKKQVRQAAEKQIAWNVTDREKPWEQQARERGRKEGVRFGWRLYERGGKTDFFDFSESRKDQVLETGQRMGIKFVNVKSSDVCNWGDIETEQGEYDFSALDRVVSRCSEYGIRVAPMIACLTGSPPEWLVEKHGKASRLTVPKNGDNGDEQTKQVGINLFHKPTREAFQRFLEAYAAHLKDKWPEAVNAVYAPGGQGELSAPADQSTAMDRFWKRWDREHGGDGESDWRPPEEIERSSAEQEKAYVRAEMCREDWLEEYIRRTREPLKQEYNALLVQTPTSKNDFHRLFAARTGDSRNMAELCKLTDNPGTSTDSPAGFALLRSFGDDAWGWSQDIHSGCGLIASAGTANAVVSDSIRVGIGGPGNSVRAYYPRSWFRYCDWQIGGFGIGSYYLTPRRCQELAPTILNTRMAQPDIAVLWSQSTLRRDRKSRYFKSVMGWGHLLSRAFFQFDYVTENDLADKLKAYDALILPCTHTLPEQANAAIREWVEEGGKLLAFGAPGLYGKLGQNRETLPLADVFGADFGHRRVPSPIQPDRLVTTHPEGSYVSIPPHDYKFEAEIYTALQPTEGNARAWYADEKEEVAIVENSFGEGRAMLSGYPVGFEYWQAAPYEMGLGLTHSRQLDYNPEQKRYEHWVAKELEKRDVRRQVIPAKGKMLRSQRGDDPDWYHVFRNNPEYREYMFETDRPVRSIYAYRRVRDGIDNLYVTLNNTQANYLWERGYFVCTMAGGYVTAAIAAEENKWDEPPVVFDTRLRVPVKASAKKDGFQMELVDRGYTARDAKPAHLKGRHLVFKTWLPVARPASYAVAPGGDVRLFGKAEPDSEAPVKAFERTQKYEQGKKLGSVEVLREGRITDFLKERQGDEIVVGCGDRRYLPAAEKLVAWLEQAYDMDAHASLAGPRATTNYTYMSGFGWTKYGDEPVQADILVGNDQSNALMWRFADCKDRVHWLPLEVNKDFPGPGHSVVFLSVPVTTRANGKPGGKKVPQQLVIGGSTPEGAMKGVAALQERQ